MADFITLSCPSCGGKLRIGEDLDQFACAHCGTEQVVRRSGNTVSLAPVVDQLKQVHEGVDKTASELAINRIPGEIDELEKQFSSLWVQRNFLMKLFNRRRYEEITRQLDQILEVARRKNTELKRHRKIVEG